MMKYLAKGLISAKQVHLITKHRHSTFAKIRQPNLDALQEARASPNGASIRCSKLHGPSTVILGDAAHGVTPALGQGCNAALESAVILSEVYLLKSDSLQFDTAGQRPIGNKRC